jgi:hypothetical protein
VALNGFDAAGLEYRGAVGFAPDDNRAVTVWLSGGSAVTVNTFVPVPEVRILLGIVYAPRPGHSEE